MNHCLTGLLRSSIFYPLILISVEASLIFNSGVEDSPRNWHFEPARTYSKILDWIPPSSSALSLQENISFAIASGASSYTIYGGGIYQFNSASLNISSSAVPFTIHGEGSLFIFTPGSAAVVIFESSDLVVNNITIDSSSPTFSQGTITSISSTCFSTATPPLICEIDIELHDGFPPPTVWCPSCETKLIFFDSNTRVMRRPQIPTWLINATATNLSSSSVSSSSFKLFTEQLWEHSIIIGDVVIVASRACGPCTYQVINSTRVTTNDVTIYSSCNMAFYELGGGGNNIYNQIRVTTTQNEDDLRYLSSNFDAFHSEGTILGPTVSNSYFKHIGDDFFNVQDAIDVVLGFADESSMRTIVVADASFGSTYSTIASSNSSSYFRFFTPVVGNAWLADEVFSATICSARKLEGSDLIPWTPLAANASAAFLSNYGWTFSNFAPLSYDIWALTLCSNSSSPSEGLLQYTSLAQVNASYGAVFINNYFEDNLVRGGVLDSPSSIFIGNTINGTQFGGLLLSAEMTWLSGNLGLNNITVSNNLFIDCCSYKRINYPHGVCNESSGAPFYPVYNPGGVGGRSTGIVIENNTIVD